MLNGSFCNTPWETHPWRARCQAARSALRLEDAPYWALTLAAAYAVKRHFASASPEELRWILAPTAVLVSRLTSATFIFEQHVGYLSRELSTAIVPACAGLNYLVMLLAMLGTAFVARFSGWRTKLLWLAFSFATAFALTLLVNALRITLGITLRRGVMPPWLPSDVLHRLEGVIVYFCTLSLLFVLVDRILPRRASP